MPLYEIKPDRLVALPETRFAEVGVRERDDLQRLLRDQIGVLGITDTSEPELLVIAEEFSDWEQARRRIDLLAIDRAANLVVIELKRTDDGGHMELQAIRYAAMVSALTWEKTVEIAGRHFEAIGNEQDAEEALLAFLGWEEPNEDEFAQDVRIILAAADFGRELTTAVMWLNQRDLEIQCIRLKPYRHGDQLLLNVEQVVPLPEAADYQVRLREKAREERKARGTRRQDLEQSREFWEGLVTYAERHQPGAPVPTPGAVHWRYAPIEIDGIKITVAFSPKNGSAHVYVTCKGEDPAAQRLALEVASPLLSEATGSPPRMWSNGLAWDCQDEPARDNVYAWLVRVLVSLDGVRWDDLLATGEGRAASAGPSRMSGEP